MMRSRNGKGQFVKEGNGQTPDLKAALVFQEVVNNALYSRSQLISRFMDPRRNIDHECGYPETHEITPEHYRLLYDREAIPTRVVQVMPQESWQSQPAVYETEDVNEETEFEKAWAEVNKNLWGINWHEDERSSLVWEYLRRADELSGIGAYGVLLLGINDGLDLRDPIKGKADDRELLFLRSFDQSLAKITRYEPDPNNPRFGQPLEYSIVFGGSGESLQDPGRSSQITRYVHWSRVIHIADNLGSSEVFGVPRMQPVYNRLLDLRKIYGGSAEMYWRGGFPGLSIETHPQLGGDVKIDIDATRRQMENYMNGLQRYLTLAGMSAKSLAPQIVDPTPWIDAHITAICIRLNIPKRIFMGSERGELSSTQDDESWNDNLRSRQENYVTPRIIVPFINRLIEIGVLPEPESFKVVWPDLDSLSEQEQALVALKRTEAMAKYIQGSVEAIMEPLDFFTRILGMTTEEAEAIIEAVMKQLKTGEPKLGEIREESKDEEDDEQEQEE